MLFPFVTPSLLALAKPTTSISMNTRDVARDTLDQAKCLSHGVRSGDDYIGIVETNKYVNYRMGKEYTWETGSARPHLPFENTPGIQGMGKSAEAAALHVPYCKNFNANLPQ